MLFKIFLRTQVRPNSLNKPFLSISDYYLYIACILRINTNLILYAQKEAEHLHPASFFLSMDS